jgi:hypothetical protein
MWSQPSNNKQQPKTNHNRSSNFDLSVCVCVCECEKGKEKKMQGGKQQGKLVIGVVVVIFCDFC